MDTCVRIGDCEGRDGGEVGTAPVSELEELLRNRAPPACCVLGTLTSGGDSVGDVWLVGRPRICWVRVREVQGNTASGRRFRGAGGAVVSCEHRPQTAEQRVSPGQLCDSGRKPHVCRGLAGP